MQYVFDQNVMIKLPAGHSCVTYLNFCLQVSLLIFIIGACVVAFCMTHIACCHKNVPMFMCELYCSHASSYLSKDHRR